MTAGLITIRFILHLVSATITSFLLRIDIIPRRCRYKIPNESPRKCFNFTSYDGWSLKMYIASIRRSSSITQFM